MSEIDTTPQIIRRLVELVAEHGLSELSVESDGLHVTVLAEPSAAVSMSAPAPATVHVAAAPPAAAPQAVSAPTPPVKASPGVPLESPMVGVFYRSASPDDPPFVSVGDHVKVGDPIGLIEAMKVFSEVPAEVAGRVIETPVASGQLVHQGQPLLYVEPL